MITIGRIVRFCIVAIPWILLNLLGFLAEKYVDNAWKVIEPLNRFIVGNIHDNPLYEEEADDE